MSEKKAPSKKQADLKHAEELLSSSNPPIANKKWSEPQILNTEEAAAFKFTLPCRVILSGPSMSGKSSMMLEFMKNYDTFFDKKFDYIIYFYPEQEGLASSRNAYISQLKEHVPDLIAIEGVPSMGKIAQLEGSKCLFLDDMFQILADSKDFVQLCTAGSHHANISFFVTTQNLYWSSQHRVTILRQMTDLIIFPGILDKSVLHTLSRQLFEDRQFLVHCFEWLHKYFKPQFRRALWIDMNCLNYDMDDSMRVRGNFVQRNPLILFSANK